MFLQFPLCFQASESNRIHGNLLSLAEAKPDKVPGSYTQTVRASGQKVLIQTSNYHTNSGIYMYSHDADRKSISLPLDDWLRSQLTTLQDFVVSHTTFPSEVLPAKEGTYVFKPLLNRDTILINVSKWCRIFKFDESSGSYVQVEKINQFGKGNFSAIIEVSHVYIGPHKGGHNFSLSMRVKQIVYSEEKQEELDSNILNELLAAEVELEKKAKRPRKTKKTDTCRKPVKDTKPTAVVI